MSWEHPAGATAEEIGFQELLIAWQGGYWSPALWPYDSALASWYLQTYAGAYAAPFSASPFDTAVAAVAEVVPDVLERGLDIITAVYPPVSEVLEIVEETIPPAGNVGQPTRRESARGAVPPPAAPGNVVALGGLGLLAWFLLA